MDLTINDVKKTARNRITRMRIGEAIIKLLDKTPLSEIRVATISQLTGISRMTFYRYYVSKEAALKDYLMEIIYLYKQESNNRANGSQFRTVEHLAFTFDFFAHFDKLILKLENIGCYKYIVDCVNEFFEKEYHQYFNDSVYDMYQYCGGIMNVFLKWIHSDRKETPRMLARIVLGD
uniref:TetR/AcrR family transcriptional regulator n=1 Tax=Eubacterium cellulosolvens TaxID=29322 RepID=UPI0004868A7F|nr:TetR/AcrR family transcriptional regulator [[Eubacterium] cellulosolvens]